MALVSRAERTGGGTRKTHWSWRFVGRVTDCNGNTPVQASNGERERLGQRDGLIESRLEDFVHLLGLK